MRVVLAVATVLLLCGVVYPGEFIETFSYPDGTFPPNWTWTGDPRGNASFLVQNGEFTHIDGSHIHYFRDLDVTGIGIYEFDALDTYWEFAWRIDPADPDIGRCLCFYHNDYWGPWSYSFTEFSWSTLGGYPEGQYMWHNGSNVNIRHYETGPIAGWRHVSIDDHGTHVEIRVDGELIFSEDFEPIPDGYIGLGSATGSAPMTPAFDNVAFSYGGSPVQTASWTRVKALYR